MTLRLLISLCVVVHVRAVGPLLYIYINCRITQHLSPLTRQLPGLYARILARDAQCTRLVRATRPCSACLPRATGSRFGMIELGSDAASGRKAVMKATSRERLLFFLSFFHASAGKKNTIYGRGPASLSGEKV